MMSVLHCVHVLPGYTSVISQCWLVTYVLVLFEYISDK